MPADTVAALTSAVAPVVMVSAAGLLFNGIQSTDALRKAQMIFAAGVAVLVVAALETIHIEMRDATGRE